MTKSDKVVSKTAVKQQQRDSYLTLCEMVSVGSRIHLNKTCFFFRHLRNYFNNQQKQRNNTSLTTAILSSQSVPWTLIIPKSICGSAVEGNFHNVDLRCVRSTVRQGLDQIIPAVPLFEKETIQCILAHWHFTIQRELGDTWSNHNEY